MFVIPCKFASNGQTIQNSYVARCVESIRSFHPDEKILIVDSDSDDLAYFEYLKEIPNVIVADIKNKNYLDGAVWYAYNEYPDEDWYCLLQDSITVKHSFDEFINGEGRFYSLMWFQETFSLYGPPEKEYLNKMFDTHLKEYKSILHTLNDSVVGCWGPCFVANREILTRLKDNGLDKCLPTDKFESNVTERLWGMCVTLEGIDIKQNTIDGDFLGIALPRELFNKKSKYHNKIYGGRQ
tara:strand:+ start:212 stop:928 length:717 start_codon:yes stop_codon:yes gene_type:complete